MAVLTQDAWATIASFINCGPTFKAMLFTSKALNATAIRAYPRGHIKFANQRRTIIRLLPDAKWDSEQLYCWADVDWEDVDRDPTHWRWDWKSLSVCAPFQRVLDHLDYPWNWNHVSCAATDDDIINHPDFPWSWSYASMNEHITWKTISLFLDKPWKWEYNTRKLDNIQRIIDHPNLPWKWELIPSRIITWDVVINNPHIPWHWSKVCRGHGVTWEQIRTLPNDICCAINTSKNINITQEIVSQNPDYPWYMTPMLRNPSIPIDFTKDYGRIELQNIMHNPRLRIDDILEHPEIPWKIKHLANNHGIAWNDLIMVASKIPALEMQMVKLSCDPRLTWDIVASHPDVEWDCKDLLDNTFRP